MSSRVAGLSPSARSVVYRFDGFELQSATRELFCDSQPVRVPDQSVQILLALLETPGYVVTRDSLRERLWPEGTFVDYEHSLNAAMKRLRAALEDNADEPRYVETLPKRGYRFIAEVHSEALARESRREAPLDLPPTQSPKGSRKWITLGLVLTFIVAAAILMLSGRRASVGQSMSGSIPQTSFNEANELYLRSLGDKLEPPANVHAIKLLERAAKLEPNSARIWYELGLRYHYESLTSVGGQALIQQALEANRHSLELDPNYLPARRHQVTLYTESGDLGSAYDVATATERAYPQSSAAHFAVSYVLRYAGFAEEAAKECEVAYKLDTTDPGLRSCAWVYVMLQQYERARRYIALDPLSTNAKYRSMDIALATHNDAEALRLARTIGLAPNSYPAVRLVEAVLSKQSADEAIRWTLATESVLDRQTDPEDFYITARYLAWAGKSDPALRALRRAINNNHCSFPAMDSDPLLASVRSTSGYAELRQAGAACRSRYAKFVK